MRTTNIFVKENTNFVSQIVGPAQAYTVAGLCRENIQGGS